MGVLVLFIDTIPLSIDIHEYLLIFFYHNKYPLTLEMQSAIECVLPLLDDDDSTALFIFLVAA